MNSEVGQFYGVAELYIGLDNRSLQMPMAHLDQGHGAVGVEINVRTDSSHGVSRVSKPCRNVTTVKQPRVEAVQGSAMVKLVALHSLQVRGRVAMLWPVPWIAHDSFYL